jgi:hypothetical protein
MRVIERRLRRLEDRLAPRPDPELERIVEQMRERRRRFLEAEGLPYEEPEPTNFPPGLSVAQALAFAVQERRRRRLARDQPQTVSPRSVSLGSLAPASSSAVNLFSIRSRICCSISPSSRNGSASCRNCKLKSAAVTIPVMRLSFESRTKTY